MTITTTKIFTIELTPNSSFLPKETTVKQGDFAAIILKNGSYIFAEILDASEAILNLINNSDTDKEED